MLLAEHPSPQASLRFEYQPGPSSFTPVLKCVICNDFPLPSHPNEKVYPLDAVYDVPEDVPEDVSSNKRYAGLSGYTIQEVADAIKADYGKVRVLLFVIHATTNGRTMLLLSTLHSPLPCLLLYFHNDHQIYIYTLRPMPHSLFEGIAPPSLPLRLASINSTIWWIFCFANWIFLKPTLAPNLTTYLACFSFRFRNLL